MRFRIEHEAKGRMRIHILQRDMDYADADILQYYLNNQEEIREAKVYDRTGDAAICYSGGRMDLIKRLQSFSFEAAETPAGLTENSGRELNRRYQEELVGKVIFHYAGGIIGLN